MYVFILVLPQRIASRTEVADDVIAKKEHFKRECKTSMQCSDNDDKKSCRLRIRLQPRPSQLNRDHAQSGSDVRWKEWGTRLPRDNNQKNQRQCRREPNV